MLDAHYEAIAGLKIALARSQSLVKDLGLAERKHGGKLVSALRHLHPKLDNLGPEELILALRQFRYQFDSSSPEEAFWKDLAFSGSQQRFLVCRLGSSGSVFLAKLIGAHPDVFCSHEGILFNRRGVTAGQGDAEQREFLRYICSDELHDAYKASGDVGSAWLSFLICAPKSFATEEVPLRTAVLHRHPLRMLKTQRHIFEREPVTRPAAAIQVMAEYFESNNIRCDIESVSDDESVNFIWTCYLWRDAAIYGNYLDVQIHVEKLNELEYAQEKLLALTGVEYGSGLLSPILGKVVNSRTGEIESVESIYSKMPESFQLWYSAIVGDVAAAMGYSR